MELESTTEIEMGTSIDIDGPDFVTIDLGDGLDGIEAIPERGDESPPNQECQGQFADIVGKSSMGKSIFKVSNAIMGSGILGLAYGMDSTGIILFLILLTFMAILPAYLIHLLLRSAGIVEDLKWEANTTAMIKKAQKALLFKDSKKMKPVCRAA